MKITRQQVNEQYNLTADWLSDFSRELEKQAYNLDYLKDLFDKRRGFSSIDEKMADIKARIGFDMVMKVSQELDSIEGTKTASANCECGCAGSCGVKTAKYKHPEANIEKMNNILDYISDMVDHEDHLDSAVVISRCRDEENLGFNDLSIDIGKLVSHIDKLLGSKKDADIEVVKYVPNEPISSDEAEDSAADYYSHAESQK